MISSRSSGSLRGAGPGRCRCRGLLLLGAGLLAFAQASVPANAQTASRQDAKERRLTIEQQLEGVAKFREHSGDLKAGAVVAKSTGAILGTFRMGLDGPFEAGATIAEYAADRTDAAAMVLAARAIDRFNDVPSEELTSDRVRSILRQDTDYAPLLNNVMLNKMTAALRQQRQDNAAFETDVRKAQKELEGMFLDIRTDLETLKGLQEENKAEWIRNRRTQLGVSGKLTRLGLQITELEQRQAKREAQDVNAIRSDLATSIRQGARIEYSVNVAAEHAYLNTRLLTENRAILNSIDTRTRAIEGGVNFLQRQEFRRLEPTEQLEILENEDHPTFKALYEGVPPAQLRERVEARKESLRSEISRQEIASGIQTGMAILNGVNQIGLAAGWDAVEDPDFQTGMKVLNLAAGLGVAYLTNNPALAVSTLVTTFGPTPKPGPSAGEAQILRELQLMDQKMDLLLEGQDKILNRIDESTEIIQNLHYETFTRLDRISEQIGHLITLSSQALLSTEGYSGFRRDLDSCNTLSDPRLLGNRHELLEHDQMVDLVSWAPREFSSCATALRDVWKPVGIREKAIHPYIALSSSAQVVEDGSLESQFIEFVERQYSPLLRLLWRSYAIDFDGLDNQKVGTLTEVIAALSEPTLSLHSLRSRTVRSGRRAAELARTVEQERLSADDLASQFATILNPHRIVEMTDRYIMLVPFLDLRDQNSAVLFSLVSEEGVARAPQTNLLRIENQLRYLLHLLNLAIAQQTLLSGDLLVPNISEIVFSDVDSELRDDIIRALDNNSVLARNVLVYTLDEQLAASRKLPARKLEDGRILPASRDVEGFVENWAYNLEAYDEIYSNGTSTVIRDGPAERALRWEDVFGDRVALKTGRIAVSTSPQKENDTRESAETHYFGLPSPSAMQRRALIVRPSVMHLLQARSRLIDFSLGYCTNLRFDDLPENWTFPYGFLFDEK